MAATVKIAILANAAQARRELGSVETAAGKLTSNFAKLRAPAAAVLGGIALGAKSAIGSASDLAESISKSNVVFGSSSGEINSWASGAAKNLGISKAAALESASSFGNMFSQLGFAKGAAADMSKGVLQMSADLGSFNNLPTAEVANSIQSAFRGEYDSLQALIPNINAARVESEAMAATGKTTAASLTAQERATAVLSIVQRDGALAQGDFARTSEGAANSSKIAAASAADLSANLGTALLPAYAFVVQKATEFLTLMNQHQGVVTAVVAVVGTLAAAVLAVSVAQTVATTVMSIARGAVAAYTAVQWALNAAMTANPIGLVIALIVGLVAVFVIAYKKSETFRNIVNGALRAVLAVAKTVWAGIKAAALAVWGAITAYVRLQIAIVSTVIRTVIAVAKAVWNFVKTGAVAAFNGVKSAVTNAISAAKDRFTSLRDAARVALDRIKSLFSPSALIDAGRRLIQGLTQGIRNAIGGAVDAVQSGLQRIKGLLPGSPIRYGPLKNWNNGGAGKRLMALLAGGIRAGSGSVSTSLANALDPATSLRGMKLATGGSGGGAIVVNITAGVGDPVEIGRQVQNALTSFKNAGGRTRA